MRLAADMILNAFLSRQPAEKQAQLIRFLPDAEKERLQRLPPYGKEAGTSISADETALGSIHWSWFLPTLKSYPPNEQSLFLAALDDSSARALSLEIPCKRLKIDLTPAGRSYLRKILLDSLRAPFVPIEYLPPSPLNRLAQRSKGSLVELIDLLAMHDLAVEIRQIVETKILKKIYSFLTDGQRRFLKQAAAKHEIMAPQKIGLDRWDGTRKSLRLLLHKKGLARLGAALSKQNPSLGWHVCHLLDIGRGSALLKLSAQKTNRAMIDTAVRQIDELLGYGP